MKNKETTFIVLEINGEKGIFNDELKLLWLDSLALYSNQKVSVDGIISERKAPCVLDLEGTAHKTATNEQIKTLSSIRGDIDNFEKTICLNE